MLRIFLGYDGREPAGYEVALRSLRAHATIPLQIEPLVTAHLRGMGLYWRPEEIRDGRRWDVISGAPMSTEFALTRFLVPALCDWEGWALFCDCDFLFRADIAELMALRDESKAVQVVQHQFAPLDATKMDNQFQAAYPRKIWSSLILFNCAHPAHRNLDLEDINSKPGLQLHGFTWLAQISIGALPEQWNWLENISPTTGRDYSLANGPIKAVHFTEGTPDMPGYENSTFADEWRSYLAPASCVPAGVA
jgi:hypothetical protein